MSAIPFTCHCGRTVPDLETWRRDWTFVGYSCFAKDEHGPEEHWEMRNCVCRSTKQILVPRGHAGHCSATNSGDHHGK